MYGWSCSITSAQHKRNGFRIIYIIILQIRINTVCIFVLVFNMSNEHLSAHLFLYLRVLLYRVNKEKGIDTRKMRQIDKFVHSDFYKH